MKNEQLDIKQEYLGIKPEESGMKSKQLGIKNIEPEPNADTRNIVGIKHNVPNKNNLKIRNSIGLTLKPYDLNPLSLAKRGRAWTRHNAQIGIPMFSTGDARKWSVAEVASYVDQIVSTKYANHNVNNQISISDRFKDQV